MKNRNDSPGLRFPPLDMSRCRQLSEHFVQSTAAHSRTKGWMPMIKLDLHHRPLNGPGRVEVLELLIRPEDLFTLRLRIEEAMARAVEDARVGIVDSL